MAGQTTQWREEEYSLIPKNLEILFAWVAQGDAGRVMCVSCGLKSKPAHENNCYGCPRAWRVINGKNEYWKRPVYGIPIA